MYQFEFAESAIPARCSILRLPLLPYSLGHEILLQRFRNVLVCGDIEKSSDVDKRAAIIQAALVCSRTWEDNKHRSRNMWLWGMLIARSDFNEAIFNFQAYRKAGTLFPKTHVDDDSKRSPADEMGSPHLACIYDYASIRFGASAFDQPLGILQFGYFAYLEMKGLIHVQNEYWDQIEKEVSEAISNASKQESVNKQVNPCQP